MADSRRHKTPSVDALVAHVEEAEKLIDLINQDLHRLDVPQWRRVAEAIKYNQDASELHLADNLLFAVSDEAWQLLAGAVLANESISALTLDNTGLITVLAQSRCMTTLLTTYPLYYVCVRRERGGSKRVMGMGGVGGCSDAKFCSSSGTLLP